jgi:hypothetical protein
MSLTPMLASSPYSWSALLDLVAFYAAVCRRAAYPQVPRSQTPVGARLSRPAADGPKPRFKSALLACAGRPNAYGELRSSLLFVKPNATGLTTPLKLPPELVFCLLVNANRMFKPFQQHLPFCSRTVAFAETSENALLASYIVSSSFDVLLR